MPESNVDELLFAPIEKPVPEPVPVEVEAPKPVPPQQTLQEMWRQQNLGASGQVLQQLWYQNKLLGEYEGLNCLLTSSSNSINDWQAQKLVEGMLNDRGMIE